MTLIAFAGRARSGKDTAAAHLVDNLGYTAIAVSDSIHDLMLEVDPYVASEGLRYSELVREAGFTEAKRFDEVRRLLIELGKGARKVFGPNVWVDAVERRLESLDRAVLTGVRFPSEVDLVRRRGGVLIYVERPGLEQIDDPTETSVTADDADFVIVNDGTIADLHLKVAEVVRPAERSPE